MKRNDLAFVKDLLPGDRFYKANDKGKKVLEIVEHAPKYTKHQTYNYWCCDAAHIGGKLQDKNTTAIKGDTQAVFLRHNEPILA